MPAVEAVPVAWARSGLLPLAKDRYTPCVLAPTKCVSTQVPLYAHPPALDVCNMQYMGNSVGYIYQKMEAYRHQLGQRQVIDDDTRVQIPKSADHAQAMILVAANWLKHNAPEKLGAGDE